jgi:hypothetical protein
MTTRAIPPQTSRASRPGFRDGKIRPAVLLWALGVPIPFVLIFLVIRGCAG